jgi:hypothetical protein
VKEAGEDSVTLEWKHSIEQQLERGYLGEA